MRQALKTWICFDRESLPPYLDLLPSYCGSVHLSDGLFGLLTAIENDVGARQPKHLAPSFFEKVQIGRSGGPEFWVIWKVRDPQDLIFKTPNRGPESPLPSQKSERPSGPHF